jgi:hypothetical protein
MIYMTLTCLVFILSLGYVVYVLSSKESGNVKIAGQVLAVLIALIALVMLVSSIMGNSCPMKSGMDCGKMGGKSKMMMEGKGKDASEAMMNMMKANPAMMQDMCKNPAMKKMMQDALKKAK